MGTDVRMSCEVRKNGKWERVRTKSFINFGKKSSTPYCYRNYELFAILAGVRNDYIHHFESIDEFRGLPEDVTSSTKRRLFHIGCGYGDSYYTLTELIDFNWGQVFSYYNADNELVYTTYANIVGEFYSVTMPIMKTLVPSGGTTDDVRIIFNFDC